MDVKLICSIAKVSRGGYYKWLKGLHKPKKDYDDYLLIKEVFEKEKGKCGFRTIKMILEARGIIINHKKIRRIMKKYNLNAKIRRKNPYGIMFKKSLEHRTCENKLDRRFEQTRPFTVFCTDITYIRLNNKFAYLSVIKDIASREIMAWSLSIRPDMKLVTDTIENLKRNKNITNFKKIMIHSDQGFHYTNPLYIKMVEQLKMIQSMSRRGNCIDNAPIETFFGHMKDDVDYKSCRTFNELYLLIKNYMEYYNHERRQWDLKKMTPVQYRDHLLEFVA